MKIFALMITACFIVGCNCNAPVVPQTTGQNANNNNSANNSDNNEEVTMVMSGQLRCIIRIWNTGELVDIRDNYPKVRSRSWSIQFGVLQPPVPNVPDRVFTELVIKDDAVRKTAIDLCGKNVKVTGVMVGNKFKTSKLEHHLIKVNMLENE